MESLLRAWTGIVVTAFVPAAVAGGVSEFRFEPVADTTLFADISGADMSWDDRSDAQGGSLWLSTTAGGIVRRSLLRFDLSAIPDGVQVVSATLTLYQSRSRDNHDVRLHRMVAPWGEGWSNAGSQGTGAQATAGDATWRWRDYLVSELATPGGDFEPLPSASTLVALPQESYTRGPTPGLLADVSAWLADPASNHGWIMIGAEIDAQNAKRFDSGESGVPSQRPWLVVQVTQIPEPGTALLLALGVAALVMRRRAGA